MELIVLGIIKVLDNIITTAKNITTYKNRKLLTSLLVIISQFLFYFVIKSVVSDNSLSTTMVVCICSGLGTYVAMLANDKFTKDILFTNILTCSNDDSMLSLCDYLLENNIKYIALDSYNRKKENSLTALAFATTRYESSMIDKFIEQSDTKYLRQVLR